MVKKNNINEFKNTNGCIEILKNATEPVNNQISLLKNQQSRIDNLKPIFDMRSRFENMVKIPNINIPNINIPNINIPNINIPNINIPNTNIMANTEVVTNINSMNNMVNIIHQNAQDILCFKQKQLETQININNNLYNSQQLIFHNNAYINILENIEKIQPILNNLNFISSEHLNLIALKSFESPFIQWINSVNLINYNFSSLNNEDIDNLFLICLATLHEEKWFPIIGHDLDYRFYIDVSNIVKTSRRTSNRRKNRINELIFTIYDEKKMKDIEKTWKSIDVDKHMKKMLLEALRAFNKKEYALTIPCLITMLEGIIYSKSTNTPIEERKQNTVKNNISKLDKLIEINNYEPVFTEYFNDYIFSQCKKIGDVDEEVPNRHAISHSWYKSYPNRKAALNAILLTDFILNLSPITSL